MEHYDRVPLAALRDPFDRFILATASQLRLPLVCCPTLVLHTNDATMMTTS
jgi:PIN domain nuclease of toxin-antitoxin system